MHEGERPTEEEFLAAPIEKITPLVPQTIFFGAGGTRRSAAMAGISPESDDYVHWLRGRMVNCFDLIFSYGVRHIFTPALIPSQMKEVTAGYREKLFEWTDWGLAGPEALTDYERLGWRVRLFGAESLPALTDAAERLCQAMPEPRRHNIWWTLMPEFDSPWERILAAAHRSGAQTRSQLVQALYGEEIPFGSLFLSFGKPVVTPALLPPLLVDTVHCYWMQRPSYELDEQQWRLILYDYTYRRATWRRDKTGRAEEALDHQAAWERGPTLGLGLRLGPFWYPAPMPLPE